MTLDESIGFNSNPFLLKSSEQEVTFLDEIFFEPNYYKAVRDNLSNSVTLYIIGQRGHGKSSIINKLLEDLDKMEHLTIKLDRFDDIPIKKNETALIKLILKLITTKLCNHLHLDKHKVKKLNKAEKEKLALFHRIFYGTLSPSEYRDVYNNLQKIKTTNWFRRQFNRLGLVPVNTIASVSTSITSDIIRQSLGLDKIDSTPIYKEYFGKIEEINFEKLDVNTELNSVSKLKQTLDDILGIVKKVGFKNTVILIDKIDEFKKVNTDINQTVNFTKDILSDTELLMNNKLAIGFSLWSELRNELSGKVRFDKFSLTDVEWKYENMEPLINRRINYFSKNKMLTLDKIVLDSNDRKDIITLADKSPRDLIAALGYIYQEQSNTKQEVQSFTPSCITQGLIHYCLKYDYDSIFPVKGGKNNEIKAMINKLLVMRLTRFTTTQLAETFKLNSPQTQGNIKKMKDYKLIKEEDILGPDNYVVADPKVEYLILRGVLKTE